MNPRLLPRLALVPASLAAAAVLGLGSPASAAEGTAAIDAVACGTPGTPAVLGTVTHPAVVTSVPAVTHLEWQWRRDLPSTEVEHVRTVIDRAHVPGIPEKGHHETRVVTPAVVQTLWEYVQHQTGRTRWEPEGWNAGENGKGWSPTGATQQVETSPAVTEQVWVVDHPAVPEVPELSHQETLWAPEGDSVPTGYVATGATRPGKPGSEQTSTTSASAPAGDGWEQVAGSEVTVVDVPAHEREDHPAWVEDIVLVPEVPAGEPCPEDDDTGGEGTDGEETDGSGAPDDGVVDGEDDVDPTDGLITEDIDDPSVEGEVAGVAQLPADAQAAADVLPATGSGAEPWLLALGAISLLAGAGLVRRSSATPIG